MNVLDENVLEDQRSLLQAWGISARQIGLDVGRKGMKDEEIIPFLHELRDVTFFTRDLGFYNRKLCHPRYCLVCLAVGKDEVAIFVRRILRHPELDTEAKRMGAVVRVSHAGLSIWRRNAAKEIHIHW
ncbi:MAG: hypothetical protein H5T64_06660 [Chloroflexi bacterium]|nr:hypothetical protein [Chloroflexota bacterium]